MFILFYFIYLFIDFVLAAHVNYCVTIICCIFISYSRFNYGFSYYFINSDFYIVQKAKRIKDFLSTLAT